MENTISRILEIEEKAQTIIRRANEEKRQFQEDFEKKLAKMESDIAESTSARLKEFQDNVERELQEEEAALTIKNESHLEEMRDLYANHCTDLVDQIVDSILRL